MVLPLGPDLTRLATLIAYDPIKGTLTWLPVPGDDAHNARRAGNDAVHTRTTEGLWVVTLDYERWPAEQIAFALASGVWTDVRRIDWNRGLEADNLELDGIRVTASGQWEAAAWIDHVLTPLGTFSTINEAVAARNQQT